MIDHHSAALELGRAGWAVFPLAPRGKEPLIPKRRGGRGLLDGTTDESQIDAWWRAAPSANIGGRVPDALAVIDVDPRAGGFEGLAELERSHPFETLTSYSGREDRGRHLFFMRPGGRLESARLPAGVDLRDAGRHYVVLPPSIHPVTGKPYRWAEPLLEPAPMPECLRALLRPLAPAVPARRRLSVGGGDRPGDRLNAVSSWAELLEPAGWQCVGRHGDVGYWRKPGSSDGGHHASTNALGTDRLHVFSTSAPPFEPDGNYSKFAALALLCHGGDYVAAARSLREAS